MYRKLVEVSPDVLKDRRIFPTFSDSILTLIAFNGVVLGRTNRTQPQLEDGVATFSGFNMRNGTLEYSIASVYSAMKDSLEIMKTTLSNRMSFLSENVLFSSALALLDSKSYQFKAESDILDAANVMVSHFMDVSLENDFVEQRLGEKSLNSLVWIVGNFYQLQFFLSYYVCNKTDI